MSETERWARDFYQGLFVELWLRAIPEQQTRQEVDFLEKVLHLPPGGSVLDLACGGGRHSLELAARGYATTGVDVSPEFLSEARKAAAQRGLQVRWQESLIHELPWEATFDGAVCLGNSLGGLDDEALAVFLRAVARALKPQAKLVVNTGFIAESLLPQLKERDWAPIGDILYLAQRRYDPVQGRLNIDYTFIRDSQVEKKSAFAQIYTYKEFCRMVSEAGFHSLEGYGSISQEPFRLGSPELFLVGRKQAD